MSYFPAFDRVYLSGAYNSIKSALVIITAALTNATTLAGSKPAINNTNFYDEETMKREEEFIYFSNAIEKLNAAKAELEAAKTALENI